MLLIGMVSRTGRKRAEWMEFLARSGRVGEYFSKEWSTSTVWGLLRRNEQKFASGIIIYIYFQPGKQKDMDSDFLEQVEN